MYLWSLTHGLFTTRAGGHDRPVASALASRSCETLDQARRACRPGCGHESGPGEGEYAQTGVSYRRRRSASSARPPHRSALLPEFFSSPQLVHSCFRIIELPPSVRSCWDRAAVVKQGIIVRISGIPKNDFEEVHRAHFFLSFQ